MDALDIKNQSEYIEYSKKVHEYSKAIGKILDLSESYIPTPKRPTGTERKMPSGVAP
jgi:hypothetical protein